MKKKIISGKNLNPVYSLLKKRIAKVNISNFDALALDLFHFQRINNKTYSKYLSFFKKDFSKVSKIQDIPFLPISTFKYNPIKTLNWETELIFKSSGTTNVNRSQHHLKNKTWYLENTLLGFESIYGNIRQYRIVAFLPGYSPSSSLVLMIQNMVKRTKQNGSLLSFNAQSIIDTLNNKSQKKTILFGVSHGLLSLPDLHLGSNQIIVMETGGMKGKRKELTREVLQDLLAKKANTIHIHSEYGMTELLSQCYSKENGRFKTSPTMKVLFAELNDPFSIKKTGRGLIQIIDMANIDSCSFISTEDLGFGYEDGYFEVNGRLDGSELRGCNLMIEDFGIKP